jgi:hypothetical protein
VNGVVAVDHGDLTREKAAGMPLRIERTSEAVLQTCLPIIRLAILTNHPINETSVAHIYLGSIEGAVKEPMSASAEKKCSIRCSGEMIRG